MRKILIVFVFSAFLFATLNADDEKTDEFDKFTDKLLSIEIPRDEFSAEGEKLSAFKQTAFLISKTGVCASFVGDRMPESILNILAVYNGKEEAILPLLAHEGFVFFKLRFIDTTEFFKFSQQKIEKGNKVTHLGKDKTVIAMPGQVSVREKKGVQEFFTLADVDIAQGGPVINSVGEVVGITSVGKISSVIGKFYPVSEILKVMARRFSNVSVDGTLAPGEKITVKGDFIDFGLDDVKDSFIEVFVENKKIQTAKFHTDAGKITSEFTLKSPETKKNSETSKKIPVIVKLVDGKQIAGVCHAENLYFEASGNEIMLSTADVTKIIIDHVGNLVAPQDTVGTREDGELLLKFLFEKFKIIVDGKETTFERKNVKEILLGKVEIPYKMRLVWVSKEKIIHSFNIEEFLTDSTKKKYQWHLPTPEIKPKGPNLVQNAGFDELDKDNFAKFWQRQDDVTSMIEEEKDAWGDTKNMVLHLKSDVLKDEYFKRLEQMSEDPIPPAFKPTKVTEKMKYKAIGASYGVSFYSDPIKIKKGITYLLEIDEKGSMQGVLFHSKIFVKGYKRMIYKGKMRDQVLYKIYMPCRNASGTWEHFSQVFSPTYRTPDVDFIKVMIFAYWPIGDYYYDNVSIREVGDHNIYNKHIHDDKKIPMKSDK